MDAKQSDDAEITKHTIDRALSVFSDNLTLKGKGVNWIMGTVI